MANADAAFGLRPVGDLSGSPYTGGTVKCVIAAGDGTATFVGDPVKLSGTGITGTDGATYPTVIQGVMNAAFFGVITSFDPNPDNLTLQYRAASTERRCNVVPALPNQLYAVQVDGAFALTSIGLKIDLVDAGSSALQAGSTTTGYSGVEADSSAIASTEANLLILGFYNAPDNDIASDNSIIIVRLDESSLFSGGTEV